MCGNFGLLLLDLAASGRIDDLLATMLRVTMARGAQSAGLVTYKDGKGTRKRVVNGKRTDLCDKLMQMFSRELSRTFTRPTIFQGHTRFATTSIAGFDGCHPHQFSPPRQAEVWRYDPATKATFKPNTCNLETFITHNGDLEFFELQEVLIPLSGLQALLPALLHSPLPNSGDSVCAAGLIELMRTAGVWKDSVRFGYVFGALEWAASPMVLLNNNELWSAQSLARVTALFEEEWKKVMARSEEAASLGALRELFTSTMQDTLREHAAAIPMPSSGEGAQDGCEMLNALAAAAVDAFFDNGLLRASRIFLEGAMGSFGLVLSTSLEADSELVVAARGQTMSIAFYPDTGVVLFGSEAAATKAAMQVPSADAAPKKPISQAEIDLEAPQATAAAQSLRLDLDDVNGEVWPQPLPHMAAAPTTYGRSPYHKWLQPLPHTVTGGAAAVG